MTGLSRLVESHGAGAAIRKDWSAPDPFFTGYKFRKPLRNIELSSTESQYRLFCASLSRRIGFVFAASIKQHKKNRGTIISIKPQSSSVLSAQPTTMALISDAKRNIFELIYDVTGTKYSVTFKLNDVTTGQLSWKKLLLEINEDAATLYVDCRRVESKLLNSRFYQTFSPDLTKLTLASAYTTSDGVTYDDFKVD